MESFHELWALHVRRCPELADHEFFCTMTAQSLRGICEEMYCKGFENGKAYADNRLTSATGGE